MSVFQPFGFVVVLTQGFALGCDVAAPLALSKCKCRSRFPAGMERKKNKCNCKGNTGVSPLRCASVEMTAFGVGRRVAGTSNNKSRFLRNDNLHRDCLVWRSSYMPIRRRKPQILSYLQNLVKL